VAWRNRIGGLVGGQRGHLVALDVAAAVGMVMIGLFVVFEPPDPDLAYPTFDGWLRWAGIAVVLTLGAPLAVRRFWPLPALAVVLVGAVAADLLAIMSGASGVVAFVLYLVAKAEPARRSLPALAVCALAQPLTALGVRVVEVHDVPNGFDRSHVAIGWGALGAAWLIGYAVRRFQRQAADLEEERTRQRIAEERLRIVRELHDVVSHSLSLITVRAGVANHVVDRRPEEAREALRVIERTSRTALTEVRQILGMLRSGELADRSPVPGLRDLPGLVEQASAAGVRLKFRAHDLPPLSEGMELTIYRIVQEAVTNVVRHAGASECRVDVRREGDQVVVEVSDNGSGPRAGAGESGGHGLVGIRERVAVYGGTLSTGAGADGGFHVLARIPHASDESGAAARAG
jgi:signal transduction histidine kinase